MTWLLLLMAAVLLAGPLRPWVGRHWAFLVSVLSGAAFGALFGGILAGIYGPPVPYLPLVFAAVCAVAAGRAGPAWLRRVQKDGKED